MQKQSEWNTSNVQNMNSLSSGCLYIKNVFNKYDLEKTGKIKLKLFLKEISSMRFNSKAPYI